MAKFTISVFGLGYVGLSTAVCFASRGFRVLGVDTHKERVRSVGAGRPTIYEPGLGKLLAKSIYRGLLSCTADYRRAVTEALATFIAVGTPNKADGTIDLGSIREASRQIGEVLRGKEQWHLVVIRSTVTPGATSQVVKPIIEDASGKECGTDWGLCMNPEFLREGSAIQDTLRPDRIVIGEHDKRSGDHLENLYKQFHRGDRPPILRMSLTNAEIVKYASNAFLAMKVSYINMIADLCERIPGADVSEVANGIGLDKRIGPLFLKAGLGYGGSCFPKDLKALQGFAQNVGAHLPMVNAIIKVNELQPSKAVELMKRFVDSLKGKRIAILGLSFKPDTDDVREAVSIKVIKALLDDGAEVVAYDPVATRNARRILGGRVAYAQSALECMAGADACIVVTEWEEFKRLRPEDFLKTMKTPVVIDGRRIFDPKNFQDKVRFAAVGLGTSDRAPRDP